MAWLNVDKFDIDFVNGDDKVVIESRVGDGHSGVVMDVKCGAGAAGTAYLECSSDGFSTVVSLENIALVASGTVSLDLTPYLAGDQSNYPLRNAIRVRIAATAAFNMESARLCIEK